MDTLRVRGHSFAQVMEEIPEGVFVSGRLEGAVTFDPHLQGEWPHTQHQPLRITGQTLEFDFAPRTLAARLHPRRRQDPARLEALQRQLADQQRGLIALELRRPPVHYLELREEQNRFQTAQRELAALQDSNGPL